jgi:hypothetical protein
MPQMIVANRLTDGLVVFYTAEGGWAADIEEGLQLESEQAQQRNLGRALADEARCIVIDPYLIDVTESNGRLRPTSIREAIRAFGPTVEAAVGLSKAQERHEGGDDNVSLR